MRDEKNELVAFTAEKWKADREGLIRYFDRIEVRRKLVPILPKARVLSVTEWAFLIAFLGPDDRDEKGRERNRPRVTGPGYRLAKELRPITAAMPEGEREQLQRELAKELLDPEETPDARLEGRC